MNTCWTCATTEELFELPCIHHFCTSCLKDYIINELENKKSEVECPLMRCSEVIPYHIIKFLLCK